VLYTSDEIRFYNRILSYLKAHGGQKAVMVSMTVCKLATVFAAHCENLAERNLLRDLRPDQIKIVSAQTQCQPWQKAFLANPTLRVVDAMLLIVTPTLQAGHSIERHIGEWGRVVGLGCGVLSLSGAVLLGWVVGSCRFVLFPLISHAVLSSVCELIVKRFVQLRNQVLTHSNEEQFFHRVRERPGLEEPELYIEPGRKASKEASYDKQLCLAMLQEQQLLLAACWADNMADKADSFNRHLE
jgi:hypothetical protein